MKKLKFFAKLFCIVFLLSLCAVGARVWYICAGLPDDIYVLEGENYNFDKYGILSPMFTLNSPVSEGGELNSDGTVTSGKSKSSVSVLGIDVKNVNVNTVPKNSLIPCGNCVGVKIFAGGIAVADRISFESEDGKNVSPAKQAGIKKGDVITSVNGEVTDSISEFEQAIQKYGNEPVSIVYKRDGKTRSTTITPSKDMQSGKYKVGLVVRDSMAGIGTLTYYCPENNTFGALGHGIESEDIIFPVQNGSIEPARVLNVVKGRRGMPGEMHGAFVGGEEAGSVYLNSSCGVFGTSDGSFCDIKNAIPIASKSEVKKGAAYILSTVEGENTDKYDIEIEKILPVSSGGKAMIIHITDADLINKTGGIVQGMSGSPIIQDEKFVGAVTHVFVNDPTRGYGIFIENMLSEAEKIK